MKTETDQSKPKEEKSEINNRKTIVFDEDCKITVDAKDVETFNILKTYIQKKLIPKENPTTTIDFDEEFKVTVDAKDSQIFTSLKGFFDKKMKSPEDTQCFLESDTYILMSSILMILVPIMLFFIFYLIILVFITLQFLIPCYSSFKEYKRMIFIGLTFLLIMLILSIFLLPAILVVLTQIFCVSSIFSLINLSNSEDIDDLGVKWLLNVFFLFLVGNEVFQSSKTLIFILLKIKIFIAKTNRFCDILAIVRLFGYIPMILPPLAQMTMAFVIYYLSICTIYVDQDMISFIENFAGFYVILEFDNIALKFMQIIDFYSMLRWILLKFTNGNIEIPTFNQKDDVIDILNRDASKKNIELLFKKILEDDQLKYILTEEKLVLLKIDAEEHAKYENAILLIKVLLFMAGLTLVLLYFNNYI